MRKYRIREGGGLFMPQWRFSFWRWRYFREYVCQDLYEMIEFSTLKEAEDFISKQVYQYHYPDAKQSNSSFSLFSKGNITQQNSKNYNEI